VCLIVAVSAFHPLWKNKANWHESEDLAAEAEASKKYIQGEKGGHYDGSQFPLHPRKLQVLDYKWSKKEQRAAVETTEGSVYFRRYIAQEVFAAQLAEYLDLCVAKSRRIPWGSAVSHAWQDVIQDVSQHITPENVARVQFLFEDQIGVQEIEFIDGAQVAGYQANRGYERILFEIGKLFAFDMFVNDPHNCRYCICNGTDGHRWTCREDDVFNFIISPTRGVCGSARAYRRLDVNSAQGIKFREFFLLAHHGQTTIELSKSLAYVAGEMFGEALTMDRREVAEALLKGARWTMQRIVQIEQKAFAEISETSGLHESFQFGMGERVRMLRIIANMEIQDPSYIASLGEVDELNESDSEKENEVKQEMSQSYDISVAQQEKEDQKEATL
jgi:hypothetical protein